MVLFGLTFIVSPRLQEEVGLVLKAVGHLYAQPLLFYVDGPVRALE